MPNSDTLGERYAVKVAGEWDDGPARAAVILYRPDVLKAKVTRRRAGALTSRVVLSEPLRRRPEGTSATLPDTTLLLLDHTETLRLFEVTTMKLRLRIGDEVMHWPMGAVKVTILPGKWSYRAVEISFEGDRLLLAAPWMGAKKKQALELIAQAT